MELLGQFNRHNDPTAGCYLFVIVGMVAIVVFLVAVGRRSAFRETLSRVATHFRGRLVTGSLFAQEPDRIEFTHAGHRAVLLFLQQGRYGRYTHLEIEWSGPPLRCEVYPETFLASVGKLMGMEDIVIGSPRFDWQFVITGDNEPGIKSLLNAQVQAVIFNLAQYVAGIHVRVSSRSLTVTCRGHIPDFPRLIEFVRLCGELYEAALGTYGQGIEFLDEPATEDRAKDASARCMVCGEALQSDVIYCRSCRTPHHRDCWSYSGGCSTYGCREKTFVRH